MVSPRRAMRPIVAIHRTGREFRPGSPRKPPGSGPRRAGCGRSRVPQDFARARRVAYPVPDAPDACRVPCRQSSAPETLFRSPYLEWKAPGRRSCSDQEASATPEPPRPSEEGRQVGADRRTGLLAARGGGLRGRLCGHRRAGPQRGLPDPDLVRLLQRREDRARPLRHPEPRVDQPRQDAGVHQGRRGRRGEPVLLERPWHRPPAASCAQPSAMPRATRPRAPRRSPSSTSRSSTSPRSRPSSARSRRPCSR